MEQLSQQLVNGVSAGMAYSLLALGLTLVFGVLHIVNFAHGEIYMVGGLTAVIFSKILGLPYGFGIIGAATASGFVAWIIDRIAVRPYLDQRDGLSTVLLSTYAVSLLVLDSVLWSWGPNPYRIDGILGRLLLGPVTLTNQRFLVLFIGICLLIAIELMLHYTRLGRDLRAISQDPFAARAIGVNVTRVRTSTFVLAAVLAGVGGALLTPITLFTPLMGQHVLIKAFVVVVIGGMGSVIGLVFCGLALGILESIIGSFMASGLALALIYSLMIAALLVRPHGLFRHRRR